MSIIASNLGFPRMGAHRELKKALESYWAKKTTAEDLQKVAKDLRLTHWKSMQTAGLDHIPVGDFSYYDQVLDMAVTLGAIPKRYASIQNPLDRYFAMARGLQDKTLNVDVQALEMTKWFDTNYHYIVPELDDAQTFKLDTTKLFAELKEAKAAGVAARPVIIGPVSFLLLAKTQHGSKKKPIEFIDAVLPVYEELLGKLHAEGVQWVQVDEPTLVLDLDETARKAFKTSFSRLGKLTARPKLLTATYFGPLGENLDLVKDAGWDGLHVDLVRAPEQLDAVLKEVKAPTLLSLGLIDGRNIWRTDLDKAHATLRKAVKAVGADRLAVAASCSLLHVPVDLAHEHKLDKEVKGWLSFAAQKLEEIKGLATAGSSDTPQGSVFETNRAAVKARATSVRTQNPAVRKRMDAITDAMLHRTPFAKRLEKQRAVFKLPLLPTTTIGSFPQTKEIREARAAWRSGKLSDDKYQEFLRAETKACVERQEKIGLDVLVHGEYERNDMVEYFGEQLEGFTFTENGWVQSFGSRCVKPPVLFGDVSRPKAMTVEWSTYAQSLTKKAMKGMLTGPVTILQWSFVRDDQPRSTTCRQIALALRDELVDLEKAGITMIQVDEPAIREGLPLRRSEWRAYLGWAVDSFRLSTSGVKDETQVHTHMCYSAFGDMLDSIAEMDADVMSIETSRSQMELLDDFAQFKYPNEVGPGVYDIHSPRVPSRAEMEELLVKAAKVLPAERLWVNPDCGLKTRGWPEVEAALTSMVQAASEVRAKLS